MTMNQNIKNKLNHIFKTHFNLDLKNITVNFEYILRKNDKENFDRLRKQYEDYLSCHPQKDEVGKRLYVDDEILVHLQHHFEPSEIEGVSLDNSIYHPWCTLEEISRIANPLCASDILLKLRADAIADSPRLIRVYLDKYHRAPDKSGISNQFNDQPFRNYINKLSLANKALCQNIPAGFVFIKDPNGICEKTEFGNIIYISESLRFYLYFMNIFMSADDFELDDRFHAFIIAVRTMLMTESLDFEIDPRGILPANIDNKLTTLVNQQIDFVIGHEYAHHILGHLEKSRQVKDNWTIVGKKNHFYFYNYKQMQEFDADFYSIQHGNYNRREKSNVVNAAIIFFLSLDLFECVRNYMYPPGSGIKKHPKPLDRMWRIHKKYSYCKGVLSVKDLEDWIAYLLDFKTHLETEFLPFHVEELERYGSVYLPSFKDRIPVDRIDF